MATIKELVEPVLLTLGYELVELQFSPKNKVVQVLIDRQENGRLEKRFITLEDCALVNSHLSRLFAAEEVNYDRLEVSSPGVDRPLIKLADFQRFVGRDVKLRLKDPIMGQKRITVLLKEVQEDKVRVILNGAEMVLLFATIERARLVPEF